MSDQIKTQQLRFYILALFFLKMNLPFTIIHTIEDLGATQSRRLLKEFAVREQKDGERGAGFKDMLDI